MKRSSVIWVVSSFLLPIGAESGWAAPCATATSACTEWLALAGGPSRAFVYRTHGLDVRNESITRALVIVHGASRNADGYYRSALAAGFLAGALDDTIIIAPRFASNNGGKCRDILASNELNFKCDVPSDWRTGGAAADTEKITSFDVADGILLKLANKAIFPSLGAIVVAGHSGGGFFVTRYEMANQVHDRLGVPVTYVVANAGSYVYLDGLRPTPSAISSTTPSALPAYIAPPSDNPPPPFAAFSDARACATYDNWPFGLQHRTSYYSARVSDEQLKTQLVARPTTYLLGRLDILPLQLDEWTTCAAMAQGPTNLARGLAWAKYINERFGARHRTVLVPLCGHNERCIFTSDVALPILFPKRTITAASEPTALDLKREVLQSENERRDALLGSDKAALDRIMASDYRVVVMTGEVIDKTGELALYSGDRKTAAWIADEMDIRVYGDTAVVIGRATVKDVLREQTRDFKFRFTHVWVKQMGGWRIASRQATELR